MASPVNIGDVIAILTQIHNVYNAYKSTPDKLRLALQKFDDTEEECRALNRILATSRRQELRSYPGTQDLMHDLERAYEYFQQFKPLTDDDGKVRMYAKAKKIFSPKWSWAEVSSHVEKVMLHRNNITNFKQTVLIQAAQDNIELSMHSIRLQLEREEQNQSSSRRLLRDNASVLSSDHMSILSKASRSLGIARQLENEPSDQVVFHLSPVIEASSASAQSIYAAGSGDLRGKLAEIVERSELHKPETLQVISVRDLEYIAELPEQWYQSRKQQKSRPNASSKAIIPTNEKNSSLIPIRSHGERSTHIVPSETIDDDTVSLSPSWKRAFSKVQYREGSVADSLASEVLLPQPALPLVDSPREDSSIAEYAVDHGEENLISGKVMITTPFVISPSIQQPLQCHLELHRTEGSMRIQASTSKTFNQDAMPCLGYGNGATPLQMLHVDDEGSQDVPRRTPRHLTFKHAVLGGTTSFPKILHPSAELYVTGSGTHPYLIEFYNHQYLQVEGYSKLPKAVKGLMYHFERKEDRDLVRQSIFGKQLLGSIGISTVQFLKLPKFMPKPCNTQAMSLWRSLPAGHSFGNSTVDAGELTLTIQCSTQGKQTVPDCAVEFVILNLDRAKVTRVRDNEGKELQLEVALVLEHGKPSDELEVPTMMNPSGGNSPDTNVSTSSRYSVTSESDHSNTPSLRNSSRPGSIILPSLRRASVTSTTSNTQLTSLRCWIKFTESSRSFVRDKIRFLDILSANWRG